MSLAFTAPDIDYAGLSVIIALTAGLVRRPPRGPRRPRTARARLARRASSAYGAAAGLAIWQIGEEKDLVAGALRLDDLAPGRDPDLDRVRRLRDPAELARGGGRPARPAPAATASSRRSSSPRSWAWRSWRWRRTSSSSSSGSSCSRCPLYVLCGSALRRRTSLESGLKYLIVGSLGSATLLYGLAFIYGGSGSTDFTGIREGIGAGLADDPLILIGIALTATGLAFKLSIAPFHQWTPDVYQGAPTPVTAFMAVATKAAAFAVFARFFEVALGPAVGDWQPALAALAAVSIIVGNVGALTQSSLKRLLGYSGIAQAGYMLVGIVAANEAGDRGALLLSRRVRVHEPRGVRGDHDPRAGDRLRRRHPLGPGARAASARCWPGR